MNYNFIGVLIIALLFSCSSQRKQNFDKEYKQHLTSEYEQWVKSQEYKKFEALYEKVKMITRTIHEADSSLTLDTTGLPLNLCFQSEENDEKIIQMQVEQTRADKDKPLLYKDYPKVDKAVNAIFISSTFYQPNAQIIGEVEPTYHSIKNSGDKKFFMEESPSENDEYKYFHFCNLRRQLTQFNQCKYVAVLKMGHAKKSELLYVTGSRGAFMSGSKSAWIYLFDLETNKLKQLIPVDAGNSAEIKVEGGDVEKEIKYDLNENFVEAVRNAFVENTTLNGPAPWVRREF